MTGPTSVALAPGNWVPLPARLFPILVGFLLLGGSAAGAAPTDAQPGTPTPGTTSDVVQESDGPRVAPRAPYALDGRSRFEMRFGVSDVNVNHNGRTDVMDVTGGAFSLRFVHWAHENLALEVSLGASNIDVRLGERFVIGIHGGTIVREGDRTPLNVGFSLGWAFGGKG